MSLPIKEWMNKDYIWTIVFLSLNYQMTHNSDKYFWKPYKTKYAFIIQGISYNWNTFFVPFSYWKSFVWPTLDKATPPWCDTVNKGHGSIVKLNMMIIQGTVQLNIKQTTCYGAGKLMLNHIIRHNKAIRGAQLVGWPPRHALQRCWCMNTNLLWC